ncbi:ribosomal protein L11 methyltransferase [Thermosinus carboxydivorans Nor1]|uniref:Ribosomal protein L11 methyltransferase n=1 Tax=Thermosinus carboxydivorans Nor1 TaxID=401526 RepID=A1HR12_9FIRM|nr:50S ribosomal protein L11 methyltransferase [Thermosinus carboxydivorans]EAX47520.1 ribosomal protein L11 methyltransferase [Thermosinus carboxydivorans Nor1]
MKWAEISIQTTHEATEAVANIFHELGASGVVIEDPEVINAYRRSGAWDYCALPEAENPEIVTVKAYLPMDDELDDKLRLFEARVNELAQYQLNKGRGHIYWQEVQEEDWASSWKNYFHPVKVGEKIVIKPSWEEYNQAEGEIIVELDPGMAFGTGTHHTTAMCIRILEDVIKPGDVVFDVGTGSGILAVVAAKLGAGAVYAVDLDPVAVNVAVENASVNGVSHVVKVAQGDLLTGFTGTADVVVANIIADVIIRLVKDVPQKLKEGGVFIASGIIAERLGDVTAAILAQGLVIDRVVEEGGWAAIAVRRGGD